MMKTNIFKYTLSISLLILFYSCGNYKDPENLKRFNLIIISDNKSISENGQLIGNLYNFLMPIQLSGNGENDEFYLPDRSSIILSLDSPHTQKSLFCEKPLNSSQSSFKLSDYGKLKTNVEKHFEDISFDSLNIKNPNLVEYKKNKLKEIINSLINPTVYLYTQVRNIDTSIFSIPIKTFQSIDSLNFALKNDLRLGNDNKHYIIIYEPNFLKIPNIPKTIVITPPVTHQPQLGQPTRKPEKPNSRIDPCNDFNIYLGGNYESIKWSNLPGFKYEIEIFDPKTKLNVYEGVALGTSLDFPLKNVTINPDHEYNFIIKPISDGKICRKIVKPISFLGNGSRLNPVCRSNFNKL